MLTEGGRGCDSGTPVVAAQCKHKNKFVLNTNSHKLESSRCRDMCASAGSGVANVTLAIQDCDNASTWIQED